MVVAVFVVITSIVQTKLIGQPGGDQQQGQMSGIIIKTDILFKCQFPFLS